jgi:hypothetical protein
MISGVSSSGPNMVALEAELDEKFVTYIIEIEKRALTPP